MVDDGLADLEHAFRDVLETGHHPQRRRLSAPGRADEHHELAVLDPEIEVVDGARPVGIDLADAFERYAGHCARDHNPLFIFQA